MNSVFVVWKHWKWYVYVIWQCCNSECIFSIMGEHITCDVIYICVIYHCDQGSENGSEEFVELAEFWAFITFLPVILTGSMFEKWHVYVKANKCLLSPLCRVLVYLLSCTDAGAPLWLVSSLSIRLHIAAMHDSKFIILWLQ